MPAKRKLTSTVIITLGVACLGIAGAIIASRFPSGMQKTVTQQNIPAKEKPQTTPPVSEAYSGKQTDIAGIFSIKVPDGWRASTSDSASFTAIMFAQPEQLSTLTYTPGTPATITSGIAAWNGLTEHFFVRTPRTSAQSFDSASHQEITAESFTFDDGTAGTKYYVVKHAGEAQKWGGLLRDNEWQGRTYIYKNGDHQVEAHLALYPSHTVDIAFFESVIKSITVE